ncbi:MAG: RNA methyltransferase [bacterium]
MNLTKNEIKYYSSLLQKKFRNAENKFIVEGKKLVEEVINSAYQIERVITTNEFLDTNYEFVSSINKKHFDISTIRVKDFEKLSDTVNPQGICAVVISPEINPEIRFDSPIIIALENISDPGNLGTIIRTCDWFGLKNILLSEECAEVYNPKVLRASMGSVFRSFSRSELDFVGSLNSLKTNGYKIICADMDGENIYNFKKPSKYVIVLCNEANGPSKELLDVIDAKITIPKLGDAESLNVASAAAIIISEFTKYLR